MKENNYFLPERYKTQSAKRFSAWDDTEHHHERYQREVYTTALKYCLPEWTTVMDIGCGSGFKLMKYFGDRNTIGVDLAPTVKWLNEQYPDRVWEEWGPALFAYHSPDIVICADCIEHVEEPDFFLDSLACMTSVKKFFISTPDRNLVRGPLDMGPPKNPAHYREWTLKEFRQYLECFFEVQEIDIWKWSDGTIGAICTHKKDRVRDVRFTL